MEGILDFVESLIHVFHTVVAVYIGPVVLCGFESGCAIYNQKKTRGC